MNILLINDDFYHPGQVPVEGVKPLEAEGYRFESMTDGAEFAQKKLEDYDVVMFVKSNNRTAGDRTPWVTQAVVDGLTGYVRRGGGLLVVHSGTAGYSGVEGIRGLFGGLFMTHPAALEVTFQPQAGHPLARGVESFSGLDEHYFMDMTDGVDVFLRSASRHGVLPAGWTRREGKGRVCVLTPGHCVELWLNPNFQRLLTNTLGWCAGR